MNCPPGNNPPILHWQAKHQVILVVVIASPTELIQNECQITQITGHYSLVICT